MSCSRCEAGFYGTWSSPRALRLTPAIDAGELRPVDPKLLAFAIVGVVNWIQQWHERGEHSVEEMASFFWDLVYEGVHATNLRVKQPSLTSEVREG